MIGQHMGDDVDIVMKLYFKIQNREPSTPYASCFTIYK